MRKSQLLKLTSLLLAAYTTLCPAYAGNVTAGSVQSYSAVVIDGRTGINCDIRVDGAPVTISATLSAFICTLKMHGVTELGTINFIYNLPAYYINISTPNGSGYINYVNSYEDVMTISLTSGTSGVTTSPDLAVIAAVAIARTKQVAITTTNTQLPLYSMAPGSCTAANQFTGRSVNQLISYFTLL